MKNLIVIKFGGSSITKKSENKFEMNKAVLTQAANELADALEKQKELQVALVCGVGPFGHTNVVKYDLNNGIKTEKQREGVKITNEACDFVGKEVAKALKKAGVKTKYIPGYEVCIQSGKKVTGFSILPYGKALDEGLVPITAGIMVKDDELVWSPMSGDVVVAQLAEHLKPKKVLMGTDVDGIYTADPKVDKNAELILNINKENLEEVLEKASHSNSVDVTGGMKGKLEKLAKQLNGVPAEIFNLLKEGNLEKALSGKEITSTKIKL
ncbi:Isopentenyl phosphate kinase [uncultured archaeon]|nr:Isopentenyl phosphate kinase [uncultured archaeon]